MATIQITVSVRDEKAGESEFRVFGEDDYELSRVPEVGELITVGEDTRGHSLDFRVLLVRHEPAKANRTDAMVYVERVNIADHITGAAKASVPADSAEIESPDTE